ncbi:MAG: hypothetical protein WCT50_02095 [Patescibacteria group bacterium]
MNPEHQNPFEKKTNPEVMPGQNEAVVENAPEVAEQIKPSVFNQELEKFRENKNDSLAEINKERESIGIPENNSDLPYEVTQAEEQLKTLYNKLGNGNYVDFEKLKNDESITRVELEKGEKPPLANAEENGSEKGENKKLEPGDEVYSKGSFYKIYDIHMPTAEEERERWDRGKLKRDQEFKEKAGRLPYREGSDRFFKEGELFEEKKRNEFNKEAGPIIRAQIKGGGDFIELDDRNIIKIETPEQREKIVKMQKEEDENEARGAAAVGMSFEKKMVDKITGQPGKF